MGLMTLANDLVQRVRSQIHEPSTVAYPRRTDAEILQWLDDGLLDYMHRVPQEHFPELTTSVAFTGSTVSLPADYMFFHSCTVTHTLSGVTTGKDECFVIGPGDSYLVNNYPGYMGAWAQVSGNMLSVGPNVFSGTLTYVKSPTTMSTTSSTFTLGAEHESALVDYATSKALLKVNDSDSAAWMSHYMAAVEAKGGRGESGDIERA
jgi:hypothetical protein